MCFGIFSPHGDGNFAGRFIKKSSISNFWNLFPSRGWKPQSPHIRLLLTQYFFWNLFPSRGWKLFCSNAKIAFCVYFGIFSPHGDGNLNLSLALRFCLNLLESFPLTGMETKNSSKKLVCHVNSFGIFSPHGDGNKRIVSVFLVFSIDFWNLFPSRGWKLDLDYGTIGQGNAFGIFSPHGDGCDYRLHDESEYLRNTPGKCPKTSTRPKERHG